MKPLTNKKRKEQRRLMRRISRRKQVPMPESDGTSNEKGFYLNARGERVLGDLVTVNDHGNVTCRRQVRNGRFVEYWSCV